MLSLGVPHASVPLMPDVRVWVLTRPWLAEACDAQFALLNMPHVTKVGAELRSERGSGLLHVWEMLHHTGMSRHPQHLDSLFDMGLSLFNRAQDPPGFDQNFFPHLFPIQPWAPPQSLQPFGLCSTKTDFIITGWAFGYPETERSSLHGQSS